MPEFETVKTEVQDFGTAGFIAVERKRVKHEGKADQDFLMVARGFYLRDGTARRRNFVTLPDSPEVREFVAKALAAI